MIVVSEIGEQWSPQTAPAMQADMEMIIISGLDFSNTATTIGIRIPKVPQEVPVANASPHPTRKIMAGRITSIPPATERIASSTNTAAPSESVIAFSVHAKVRIMIAGTIALNPSGMHPIQSLKLTTRRII